MAAIKRDTKAGLSNSPFRGSGGFRVAIQGYEGSFHQEAARKFFGKNVEVIPCDTFRQVVKIASDKKESDGGVMAIENSIAGSILPITTFYKKVILLLSVRNTFISANIFWQTEVYSYMI